MRKSENKVTGRCTDLTAVAIFTRMDITGSGEDSLFNYVFATGDIGGNSWI